MSQLLVVAMFGEANIKSVNTSMKTLCEWLWPKPYIWIVINADYDMWGGKDIMLLSLMQPTKKKWP